MLNFVFTIPAEMKSQDASKHVIPMRALAVYVHDSVNDNGRPLTSEPISWFSCGVYRPGFGKSADKWYIDYHSTMYIFRDDFI
jgi:hypothetical protein